MSDGFRRYGDFVRLGVMGFEPRQLTVWSCDLIAVHKSTAIFWPLLQIGHRVVKVLDSLSFIDARELRILVIELKLIFMPAQRPRLTVFAARTLNIRDRQTRERCVENMRAYKRTIITTAMNISLNLLCEEPLCASARAAAT